MSEILGRAAAWAKWAWNPPADAMIRDHEFVPLGWMSECGAIPGHPDGDCPTRGRCQHNHCGKPKRHHVPDCRREQRGDGHIPADDTSCTTCGYEDTPTTSEPL